MLIVVLILFVGVSTIGELRALRFIGADSPLENNTMSVSGEGEIFAPADIAQFNFSVIETAPAVGDAQGAATETWNTILARLKAEGIEERDIKTIHYGIEPQYAPQRPNVGWVPLDQREIIGYIVTQTAEVKVRDVENVGKILTTVGTLGARNVSGISFTFDDESELVAQAREKAIQDARENARRLAKNLGVSLGRIVTFREHRVGIPHPFLAGGILREASMDTVAPLSPDIAIGENRIVVNVEIVFTIR